MEIISNALGSSTNYLKTMGLADFLDIIIVAYLLYNSIWLVRRNSFNNLAKGILAFLAVLWLSEVFGLTMINFLMRKAFELGLIALLILFQPELRRILERAGSRLSAVKSVSSTELESCISQVVEACADMSRARTGALIIFERSANLTHIISTGTVINADTTAELLKNIFYNKAPLHDGAVIMRESRIASAGCVLPLTENNKLSKELGMRHRAGIGLSEVSDAVVIIVSEETGAISVAIEGMLKRHQSPEALDAILHRELVREEDNAGKSGLLAYVDKFRGIMYSLKKGVTEDDEKNI